MFNNARAQLFFVKVSRLVRGTIRKIKRKLSKSRKGSVKDFFGKEIPTQREINRERKFKSTFVMFIAGTAIGISQLATISAKYRTTVSLKSTIILGVVVGVLSSTFWYKYMRAAVDDVHEEDLEMVFEMVQHTGRQSFSVNIDRMDSKSDYYKHVDILHTIITGKDNFKEDLDEDGKKILKVEIPYEDELESEDKGKDKEKKFDSSKRLIGIKPSFEKEDRRDSTSGGGNRFRHEQYSEQRNIGISKPLSRRSLIPDIEDEGGREVRPQVKEGWLDI